MKAIAPIALLAMSTGLTGCASTITAYKNRAFAEHHLKDNFFYTITGERRLAFTVAKGDKTAWCAESLPEVSQAVSATSKPSLQTKEFFKLGTEDQYGSTLTQTFTRTEIAEIYRQSAWQACQAWAQGVYTDAQYATKLDLIIAAGLDVIHERARQSLPAVVTPATGDGAKLKKDEAVAAPVPVPAITPKPDAPKK